LLVTTPEIRMHYTEHGAISQMKTTFNLALAIALAATLGASHAEAQGNSRGRGNDRDRDRDRTEQRDRDRDRDDDDDDRPRFERRRDDDRRDDNRYSRSAQQRRVPPGWCQGRGNPHNTAENCRYNSQRSRWERYDSRTGRYETYETYGRNRDRTGSSSGSYDQAHRDFHYSHDRRCRERAAQRPLDVRYQVQVRSECKATHDDFHRRWGTAHR
jgi:hypothetical protein